jgi:hypothetical protein
MLRHPIYASAAFVAGSLAIPALAHPGHDHSHWSGPALHGAFFLALLVSAAALWWSLRARHNRQALRARPPEKR